MEKITLIIPVYNAERYLRSCLDSALAQSYENYEIVLVNDGSTDATREICQDYAARWHRIRFIDRAENRGLVYTWQEGVAHASGSYLAFLDSDDWVDSRYLESLASGIPEGADIVCCNYNRVYPDQMLLQTEGIAPGTYSREQLLNEVFPVLLNDGTYFGRGISPHRCGKLFRRELIAENMHFCHRKISYGEDLNIFFAAIQDCGRLKILDDRTGLYYYRQNQASIIHTYTKNMFSQIVLLRQKLLEIMEAKQCYDFSGQLSRDFWCQFVDYVKNETGSGELSRSAGEVCRNFAQLQKEVPWDHLRLKPADSVMMFCLRHHLYGMVSGWMKLYAALKKV